TECTMNWMGGSRNRFKKDTSKQAKEIDRVQKFFARLKLDKERGPRAMEYVHLQPKVRKYKHSADSGPRLIDLKRPKQVFEYCEDVLDGDEAEDSKPPKRRIITKPMNL